MIINKLTLFNVMCYYDKKTFEFSDGLNIILGHNGDGKSTIFTAFNWIFDEYSDLQLSDLYSKKRYSEILANESFEVFVELIVTQYNEEYKIKKSFTVIKEAETENISGIKEEIWRKDLSTGDKSLDGRSISNLAQQVFPEAFRNFSMFETETDALKIVEGEKLADLVKNFSNAKYYEKLEKVINSFAVRSDKQFRKESDADLASQNAIDKIDIKIEKLREDIDRITAKIEEDEKGRDFYSDKISEIVKNLTISETYQQINLQIEKLNSEITKAREENKVRGRFTDQIFDQFYILSGFDNIFKNFSSKVNLLRQEKNRVDNDERNKYAQEKLELNNGSTPFPPGFPSLEILYEILNDKICKICNTELEKDSEEYINSSIKIFEEGRKKEKELDIPVIFPNNFIDEFQLIERSVQLKPEKYSPVRIAEEIEFGISRISANNSLIAENNVKISALETEKGDLLNSVQNLSESELKNIQHTHETYCLEKDTLVGKIGENKVRLEQLNSNLNENILTRNRTLAQFKDSNFKKSTVDFLNELSSIAMTVKDYEYNKFLTILSERATQFLKQINVGEITGKIQLYKKNNNEVSFKSLNDDNSIRSTLEDSGALQISKPLSILFAIADIAAETSDNETYPMIFDAPTGRFSPDREKEFFKVLKSTNKQRIVVTLRFLGVDKTNTPFVNKELFQNIEKDKSFFIKRVRPFELDKPETINTEIEEIY